jgi:hypothetical protein
MLFRGGRSLTIIQEIINRSQPLVMLPFDAIINLTSDSVVKQTTNKQINPRYIDFPENVVVCSADKVLLLTAELKLYCPLQKKRPQLAILLQLNLIHLTTYLSTSLTACSLLRLRILFALLSNTVPYLGTPWGQKAVHKISHLLERLTLFVYCDTYLRGWALLEEWPTVQPLKNFPAFYGTRKFITIFTGSLHWYLSWAISIQSTPSYLSKNHFNIVQLRPGPLSGLSPSGFPTNILYAFLFSICASCPAHLILLYLIILFILVWYM